MVGCYFSFWFLFLCLSRGRNRQICRDESPFKKKCIKWREFIVKIKCIKWRTKDKDQGIKPIKRKVKVRPVRPSRLIEFRH